MSRLLPAHGSESIKTCEVIRMARETKKKSTGTPGTARSRKTTTRSAVAAEERHRMIAEAAYYKALERGPANYDPVGDWVEAEAEIDAKLLEAAGGPRRAATTGQSRARGHRKEPLS